MTGLEAVVSCLEVLRAVAMLPKPPDRLLLRHVTLVGSAFRRHLESDVSWQGEDQQRARASAHAQVNRLYRSTTVRKLASVRQFLTRASRKTSREAAG